MKQTTLEKITLGTRRVDYHLFNSPTARKVRIRIGPSGVQVVKPAARDSKDVTQFLRANEPWILNQLGKLDTLGRLRRVEHRKNGQILFRGQPTKVRVENVEGRQRENRVFVRGGNVVIQRGRNSRITTSRSLENWLRKQAREEIQRYPSEMVRRLKKRPNRVYVMSQRTKWGNCSRKNNLSFNWRLILAPTMVLKYLVAHEAVHLVVKDHSQKFWLLLRSIYPETMQAKRWLEQQGHKLSIADAIDLK
jgi:predicted metal-dependent hydrolase